MNFGSLGLLRSKICVIRVVRQLGKDGFAVASPVPSETRYAIPVSHCHQLLCVFGRFATTVFTRLGLLGLVTSTMEVPFFSTALFLSGLAAFPPWWPTYAIERPPCSCTIGW